MLKYTYSLALIAAFFIVAFTVPGFATEEVDLTGEYFVEGWEPGSDSDGPDYTGVATIRKYGESWMYHGVIDSQSFLGVGIFDAKANKLSLSFTNPNQTESGVTVLENRNGRLIGNWVYVGKGDGMHGKEVWVRQ